MSGALKTIGSIFSPALAVGNALFGGKTPKPEKVAPPAPLPDLESPAARLAAKKKIEAKSGGGRAGTIYGSYSQNNLGGTA